MTGQKQLARIEPADLSQYQPEKYQVLARPEDLACVASILRAEVVVVTIDARDVNAGGETHNIGGQTVLARSAVDRIGDAAGVTFDEHLCSTRKEGPRLWVGRAVGRRRQPDGTWRTAPAEYEWDVDVREAEARARLEHQVRIGKIKADQVEPKLAGEVIQMMKFGRARADTGARLRTVRILTGMKTGFSLSELQRPFVLARFSVNTEALMADPEMRQALVQQALGGATEVYGPREPRNVTPAPEQLAGQEELEAVDDLETPAVPDGGPSDDEVPWDETPEDIARRGLSNYLSESRHLLPQRAIDQLEGMLTGQGVTLAQMQALDAKVADYLQRKRAAQEAGA